MGIVTLVSGGIDSTIMSILAHEEGIALFPLFVDYGQLAAGKEWEACQRVHEVQGLPEVVRMDLSGFGKTIASGLTNSRLRINEDAFLPGRNLLFVLAGAAYASMVQAESVAIGLLDPAYHLFPDQTPQFVEESERIVEVAMGTHITILAPLMAFSKRDILDMARARELTGTYSCHAGGEKPCGMCVSCLEIAMAEEGD